MISEGKKKWSEPRLRRLEWWKARWFAQWLELALNPSIAK